VPRAGQVKPPADERLPDRIAIGLLTVTFPPELVDRVVAETGRVQRRSRLLPARVVVYYVLAMCLFFGQGYEEVARLLTEGLAYARRWSGTWRVPTTAAITRARARLGPEPLRALFAAVCTPMATETTAGAFYRAWRLVAVDGTTFDLPDTVANADHFGRPGSPRGRARAPSRRSGSPPWESAARMRSSLRRWAPWRCMRPSWPGGCSAICGRGCC
jgi:Insertion element 4 transposase N-terminal